MTEDLYHINYVAEQVRHIVFRHCGNGSTYMQWQNCGEDDSLMGYFDASYKQFGGVVAREVRSVGKCRGVELVNPSGTVRVLVTKSDIKLYDLVWNYYRANRGYIDRMRKYIDMYLVYENYSQVQDIELKAIRHSFSHSRRNLTHTATIQTLVRLFGDVKVDFDKKRHRDIFNQKFSILAKQCEELLVEEIIPRLPPKPNLFDVYYTV